MRRDQKYQSAIDWRMSFDPGDYGKGNDGRWFARVPSENPHFIAASLENHEIVENADGTITVSPSILMSIGTGEEWHGYLKNGNWTTV